MNSLIFAKDLFYGCEALTEGIVHLWTFSMDQVDSIFNDFKRVLSAEERVRAENFIVEQAQKRFILFRGMLRLLLAHYLEKDPCDVSIVNGAYGKPQLSEAQETIQFNLSHSDELALFAFIRNRRIGVDIEKVREIPNMAEMARRFFSSSDRETFFKLSPEKQKGGFFSTWTRMEAFLKALGRGLHFPLDEASFSQFRQEKSEGEVLDRILEPMEQWSFYDLSPGPDYKGSLVIEGQGHKIEAKAVTL